MSGPAIIRGVVIVTEDRAPEIFQQRGEALLKKLDGMPGLRSADIALQRNNLAVLEQYTLYATCDADDEAIAVATMTIALDTFSEGLMHVVRRMPEGNTEKDFETGTVHHVATVRATIINQPGARSVAQRGHEPISIAGGVEIE